MPVEGAEPFALTIDDIWPADAFPEERAVYEAAGFEAGSFSSFAEAGALVLTGAHSSPPPTVRRRRSPSSRASFNDFELVARITSLEPGSLNLALPLAGLEFGDRTAAVILSGPEAQVVGIIWITGNLLQFVRVGMALGDEDRTAAVLDVAQAMADRMG